ncbi:MAG TPA: amidohydrolase [Roseiarcus sp.]|nr:amidohydrolase [Roseiarcus sp.]
MSFLSARELAGLAPPDEAAFRSPVPTQMVSNAEFNPLPQTETQREVEARIKNYADKNGRKHGMDLGKFLRSPMGMAAAFVAMNDVYGDLFAVDRGEDVDLSAALARQKKFAKQFVFDGQVHFVRDDYTWDEHADLARFAADHGWNPALGPSGHITIDMYKFDNFFKEIYFDSDTHIGLLSGAPTDDPDKTFLSNDQIKEAADFVNGLAKNKRLYYHAMITPKSPAWMEEVDRAIEVLKPTSWKGYTVGDPILPETARYPWRLDDEQEMYPFYEKAIKSGVTTVCIHKGLLPADYMNSMPNGWKYATADDVGKAAKDWPQIDFVIYHSALAVFQQDFVDDLARYEKTGELRWVNDLAKIPEKFGVTNVYADLGTVFGCCCTTSPRIAGAILGMLIKGLGYDHLFWGTDAVWQGGPQWRIEAFRRLEIPEDLQKRFGYAPLGEPDGPVKSSILGLNAARHYNIPVKGGDLSQWEQDGVGKMKLAYLKEGGQRSNAAYGYVVRS